MSRVKDETLATNKIFKILIASIRFDGFTKNCMLRSNIYNNKYIKSYISAYIFALTKIKAMPTYRIRGGWTDIACQFSTYQITLFSQRHNLAQNIVEKLRNYMLYS